MSLESRALYLLLIMLLLLAGCGQETEEQATPPATVATALPEAATAAPPIATLAPATLTATALPPTPALPTPTPTPAYPVYSGPPLNRGDIGVQLHTHRQDLGQLFDHLEALGVGWVKVQVSWKLHQPSPDRYSDEYFAELDNLVALANAHQVAVLLSVAKAPEWSRPTTELDGPPNDYTLYRTFMQHLAGRYQGRVAAYELWNEANLQREWNGVPLSAADLVALMRAGAAGVNAADPDAILVSGAPATTGINDGVVAIDDRLYLRQMLAAGVTDTVDAIGAHPYGWANPPDSSASAPDPAVPSHNNHPSFFFGDTLMDYAAILDEFGSNNTPIWVTEFGWGTFETFSDEQGMPVPPPAGAEFMAAVSEWQQAIYILRAYELGHEWARVGPMFLWNLNFGPLLGTDFSEAGYSLLRPDGSPRPAYLALQAAPKQ